MTGDLVLCPCCLILLKSREWWLTFAGGARTVQTECKVVSRVWLSKGKRCGRVSFYLRYDSKEIEQPLWVGLSREVGLPTFHTLEPLCSAFVIPSVLKHSSVLCMLLSC